MSPPRAEVFSSNRARRAVRWLWPAALLAVAPKCVLCLVAYAGLGAALGLGGPELCGAVADETPWPWPSLLAALSAALALAGVVGMAIRRGPADVDCPLTVPGSSLEADSSHLRDRFAREAEETCTVSRRS